MSRRRIWIVPDGEVVGRPVTEADGVLPEDVDDAYHQHEYGAVGVRHEHEGAIPHHKHAVDQLVLEVQLGRAEIYDLPVEVEG